MRTAFAVSAVALALVVAPGGGVRAQTSFALEGGVVTAFDEGLFQLGFRASPLVPGRAGADVAFATFPDALINGFFIGMIDLDVTYGVPLGANAGLYPRFGVSGLAGAGEGGGGGVGGVNFGGGIMARPTNGLGIRFDYTYRRFYSDGESQPLSSISVGLVLSHK